VTQAREIREQENGGVMKKVTVVRQPTASNRDDNKQGTIDVDQGESHLQGLQNQEGSGLKMESRLL